MKITRRFKIPYEKEVYNQLKQKSFEAGNVWSDILKYANEYYKTTKKWLSKSDLENYTKNNYNLSSQSVQGIVAKYETNRQATRELRKNNKKIKYPWKYKTFFCVPYKQASLEISEDKIILKNSDYSCNFSLAKHLKIANKKRKNKKDKSRFEKLSKQKDYIEIPNLLKENVGSISYAETTYENGHYYFNYVMDVKEKENQNPQKPAGGDLGEIHSISIATENKALIVSGRAIRSLKQYKQKMLAQLNKKMSRCKKKSRQWKKYNNAKKRLSQKTDKQLVYLYHKTTKQAVDFLIQENVTDFVVGDPKGIEKNTKKQKKQNKTRRH